MKEKPNNSPNPSRIHRKPAISGPKKDPAESSSESERKAMNYYNSRPYSPHNFHKDPGIVMGYKMNAPPLMERLGLNWEDPKEKNAGEESAEKPGKHSASATGAPTPPPPSIGGGPRIQRQKQPGNHPPKYDPGDPEGKVIHFHYDLKTHAGSKSVAKIKPGPQSVKAFHLHLSRKGEDVANIELDAEGNFIHELAAFQLDYHDFEALAEFLWLDYLHAYDFLSISEVRKIARSVLNPKRFRMKSGATQSNAVVFAQPDDSAKPVAQLKPGISVMIEGSARGWAKVLIDGQLTDPELHPEGMGQIQVLTDYKWSESTPVLTGYIKYELLADVAPASIVPETVIEVRNSLVEAVREEISNPEKALLTYQRLNKAEKRFIDPETRYRLVRYMVGETGLKQLIASVGHWMGRDEERIIGQLIKYGDSEYKDDLMALLVANKGKNFEMMQSTLFGDDYRKFHDMLGEMAQEEMPFEQKAAFAGSLMKQGSHSPFVVDWSDPGLLRENYEVQTEFDIEFTEKNNLKVTYTRFTGLESAMMTKAYFFGSYARLLFEFTKKKETRIFAPYQPIAVRFLIPEEEYNAHTGDIRIMPAINLYRLRAKHHKQESINTLDMGMAAMGGGEVAGLLSAGKAGMSLSRAVGLLDAFWGGADRVVEEYSEDISNLDSGREFLFAWNIVNSMISAYGLAHLAKNAPDLFHDLFYSWDTYKTERNLSKVRGDYDHLDDQVEATMDAFWEAEEAIRKRDLDIPEELSTVESRRSRSDLPGQDAKAGPRKTNEDWSSPNDKSSRSQHPEAEGRTRNLRERPNKKGFLIDENGRKYTTTPDGHHIVKMEFDKKKGKWIAVICSRCKSLKNRFEKAIEIGLQRNDGYGETIKRMLDKVENGTDEEKILVSVAGYAFLDEVKIHTTIQIRLGGHPYWKGYNRIIKESPSKDILRHLDTKTKELKSLRSQPEVQSKVNQVWKGNTKPRAPKKGKKPRGRPTPTRDMFPIPKEQLPTMQNANIHEVNSMQSSVSNHTGKPNPKTGLFDYSVLSNSIELRRGNLSADVLGPIRVWMDHDGRIWTLDHRRLMAYKLAGYQKVPTEWANLGDVLWDHVKMTTEKVPHDWGRNVEILVNVKNLPDDRSTNSLKEFPSTGKFIEKSLPVKRGEKWIILDSKKSLPQIKDVRGNTFTIDEISKYYFLK